MSSRDEFEAWWEINYHNGKPPRFGWAAWRDGDGYKIDDDESELDGMWNAWQAATNSMEAKCAALAAENAKKSRCLGFFASVIKSGESWTRFCQHEYNEAQETPATDAFMAEVRAQGVEKVIAYHHERSDALTEVDRDGSFRHLSAAIDATDVLMKIRQEAAK